MEGIESRDSCPFRHLLTRFSLLFSSSVAQFSCSIKFSYFIKGCFLHLFSFALLLPHFAPLFLPLHPFTSLCFFCLSLSPFASPFPSFALVCLHLSPFSSLCLSMILHSAFKFIFFTGIKSLLRNEGNGISYH